MDDSNITHRNGPVSVSAEPELRTASAKDITTAHPAGKVKHGSLQQALRLVLFVLYFLVTAIVILCTQIVASPLYLINRHLYYTSIALTKQMFGIVLATITQWWAPTLFRVSGDSSVANQLHQTEDGMLRTNFPERLVMISNHQIYTDWLYFWWIAYTSRMHGYIYIVLKESIKLLPIFGQGMMFYEFIFLSRKWATDESRIARAMRHLSTPYTGNIPNKGHLDPMWLLLFPEGTNLGKNGRQKSATWARKQGVKDMRHLLIPRSTGLLHSLKGLNGSVEWVYDCTIAYEGIPEGQFGEDIFTLWSTYFQGRPPKSVNMYWRRFAISSVPLNDVDAFQTWLQDRWNEKDDLLQQYQTTGRFPPLQKGATPSSNEDLPYINTQVQLSRWTEVGEIFAPLLTAGIIFNLLRQLFRIVLKTSV